MIYNYSMKTVIFGCGKIAHRIVKGFSFVKNNELVGFGSSDPLRAKEYALKYNTPLYGTYDELLNNSDVDAIYVATYNPNHYELIKKCLQHKKHVICEKPMLYSKEVNNEMFDIAKENNVLLMEAMKAVFQPINIKVKQMISDGIIGEVKYMEATFVRHENFPQGHWIYDLKTGGALKDVGSYCAGILNFMNDAKPTVIYKHTDASDVADMNGEVLIDYDGVNAHLLVSKDVNIDTGLTISGSKGYIKIPNFWKAQKGYYVIDNERHEIEEEMIDDFYYEIQHFTDLINNNILESPIMSKDASNNILEITQ